MWKCPVCGTENIEEANFCKECGTKRGTVEELVPPEPVPESEPDPVPPEPVTEFVHEPEPGSFSHDPVPEPAPPGHVSRVRELLLIVLGGILAVTVVVTALNGGFSGLPFLPDRKGSAASAANSIDADTSVFSERSDDSGTPAVSELSDDSGILGSPDSDTTAPNPNSTVPASSESSDRAGVPSQTITPVPSAPAQTVTPVPSASAQTVTSVPSAPAQAITPEPSVPDNSNGAALNSTTEHRYEVFIEDVSWPEAFQRAKAKGGRLAIIRNENEWNKVYVALEQVNNPKASYYIGAIRDNSTASGPYYWVYDVEMNGSNSYKFLYFDDCDVTQQASLSGHWLSGEPSYQDTVSVSGGGTVTVPECCLAILRPSDGTGWWVNDENDYLLDAYPSPYDFHGKIGYIVEYDQ